MRNLQITKCLELSIVLEVQNHGRMLLFIYLLLKAYFPNSESPPLIKRFFWQLLRPLFLSFIKFHFLSSACTLNLT
ncbi:hypothetical protein QVD17_22149 [Tagetes erecta]|uniref:Uncharacterized protein n=1 Tax=Tagetes erecta TaxID=13708 RepID=A0AAD8KCP7_TARER|nr:hypothetical protein QVD17_22149 [Tagetes erecta]